MKVNLISDSSIALNKELEEKLEVKKVPFFLELDDEHYLDDDKFDTLDFVNKMKESDNVPKSAAPSPQAFFEKIEDDKENFIITISSKLSGTYQNAKIAEGMAENKYTYVIDSKSAVTGPTLIAIKLKEFEEKGYSFDEKVEKIEEFVSDMETFFVLEDFTNLIKNGRARKIAGALAKVLHIVPLSKGKDGSIELLGQARGMKRALKKLVDEIVKSAKDKENKICVIAHVFNEEAYKMIKKELEKRNIFESIEIVEPSGLGASYANKGGIVVSF